MADETVGDRLAALDLMGIDRQLVFAPVCWPTLHGDDERSTAGNRSYNDWALDWADGQDRVRPVVAPWDEGAFGPSGPRGTRGSR